MLACFLSWDGGVRGGSRITLPIEKTETVNPGQEIERSASPVPSQHATIRTIKNKRSLILSPAEEPTGFSTSVRNPRRDSRASLGTAYGCVILFHFGLNRTQIGSDTVELGPNTRRWPREPLWRLLEGCLRSSLTRLAKMFRSRMRRRNRGSTLHRGSSLVGRYRQSNPCSL